LYDGNGNAKTILYDDDGVITIGFNPTYHGKITRFHDSVPLIPKIADIKIERFGQTTIRVRFKDNTEETAVLAAGDTFDLENGINICLIKRLLSAVSNGNGSALYNKLYSYGAKEYKNIMSEKLEKARKAREGQEIRERRIRKKNRKMRERVEKRRKRDKERNEDIDYLVDTIRDLMRALKDTLEDEEM
jgi:hypothetical protein